MVTLENMWMEFECGLSSAAVEGGATMRRGSYVFESCNAMGESVSISGGMDSTELWQIFSYDCTSFISLTRNNENNRYITLDITTGICNSSLKLCILSPYEKPDHRVRFSF
jgi:hypothetical protein